MRRPFSTAILMLASCTPPAHLVLNVEDPEQVATEATQLAVGFDLDDMRLIGVPPDRFPMRVTLTSSGESERDIWVEARSGSDVIARAWATVSFERASGSGQTVVLRAACGGGVASGATCLVAPSAVEGICVDNRCQISVCGDGFADANAGEECDDGNPENQDSCLTTCVLNTCGDGFLFDALEDCDDGNVINNDDCLFDCTENVCGDGFVNAGPEECDYGPLNEDQAVCKSDCSWQRCGDGFIGFGEDCDDGPGNANDADCKLDCSKQRCGDGHVGPGEECDDGNIRSDDDCIVGCLDASCGDGWLHTSTEECDFGVLNSDTGLCTLACENAFCGDGKVGPGEACDDGNDIDGDKCSNSCELPDCGDSIQQPDEPCDDGNLDNTDACLNNCAMASCGDGYVWAGHEDCDDGVATSNCDIDCTLPECGDGVANASAGEACDDGDAISNGEGACVADCSAVQVCGDGVRQGTEQCDDGQATQVCRADCSYAPCQNPAHLAGAPFAYGDGSDDEPFVICTAEQLNEVGLDAGYRGCSFSLHADIDLSVLGEPIAVIGGEGLPFTGTFQGNGHIISNLTVDHTEDIAVGLFGDVEGGLIERLSLESVSVTGERRVGALVGSLSSGTVSRCSSSGTVSAIQGTVGGLVGYNSGIIHDSWSDATVSSEEGSEVGGLAGASEGLIQQCYASGTVSGVLDVGGLIGAMKSRAISAHAFAVGSIIVSAGSAGGVLGAGYDLTSNSSNLHWADNPGDSAEACVGRDIAGRIPCEQASSLVEFYDPGHPVYTEDGAAWNFSKTWLPRTGALPVLRRDVPQ